MYRPSREERTLPESILLWFLQVLGAVTAILFGAFGVLAWQAASESNQLSQTANAKSDTANLVALVALCAPIGADADVSMTSFLSLPPPPRASCPFPTHMDASRPDRANPQPWDYTQSLVTGGGA